MQPKDKTLNQQLIDHIDILYKMIGKVNSNVSVENKTIRANITKLSKRVDKLSKKED